MKKGFYRFSNFCTFIEEVRNKPQMYHGGEERNILLFSALISGIVLAEEYYGVENQVLTEFDWERFESWVEDRYNNRKLSFKSFTLANYLSESSEQGFDLWFSWYDEFRDSEQ